MADSFPILQAQVSCTRAASRCSSRSACCGSSRRVSDRSSLTATDRTLRYAPRSKSLLRFGRGGRMQRRGATVVEMAIVLPTFFTFVFGIIQFGHAMWVNNLIRNAVRESARFGSTEGVTTAEVEASIRSLLAGVVAPEALTIEIRDASSYDQQPDQERDWDTIGALPEIELFAANPRQLFVVRAAANLEDVALIRLPFPDGVMLCGESFMRHE